MLIAIGADAIGKRFVCCRLREQLKPHQVRPSEILISKGFRTQKLDVQADPVDLGSSQGEAAMMVSTQRIPH